MPERAASPPAPSPALARDQGALLARGLTHIRRLAGQVWTDHNLHDPGITILEVLCYALTDLAYRASFPVEDLLARAPGEGPGELPDHWKANQALPCAPLTDLDYRRLLLDLKDVRNAWIEPAPTRLWVNPVARVLQLAASGLPGSHPVTVRGLYRVTLELAEDADQGATLEAATQVLRRNRNLCEEFVSIHLVPLQWFKLCGELELQSEAVTAEVLADVFLRVERLLSPPLTRRSLAESLTRRRDDGSACGGDDVFDGPRPLRGFLDAVELGEASLPKEVRLSDVIRVVLEARGVVAVRDLALCPVDPVVSAVAPADHWRVPVLAGARPALDVPRSASALLVFKGGIPCQPDAAKVTEACKALKQGKGSPPDTSADPPIPAGKYRDVSRYPSIRHHLPGIYGVGDEGLPPGASGRQRAQALQLKAYLRVFDQVMGDFCAQLEHTKDLLHPDVGQTSFHQRLEAVPDWKAVFAEPALEALLTDDERALAAANPTQRDDLLQRPLQRALDEATGAEGRAGRFLDHLLDRLGEQLADHVGALVSLQPLEPPKAELARTRLKRKLLKAWTDHSRARGLGAERPGASADARSGLERRVAALLDLAGPVPGADPADAEQLIIVECIQLRLPGFADPQLAACLEPAGADDSGEDPYSYRVQVVLPARAGRFSRPEFRRFAEDLIRQELPAHVLPRICWVGPETWRTIEGAWRAWGAAADQPPSVQAPVLQALRDALAVARSEYPTEPLRPCKPGDERPKFLLNQTRLRSESDPDDDP